MKTEKKYSQEMPEGQISVLLNENALYKNENLLLKQQLSEVSEQLSWLKRQLFGKRSEKIIRDLDYEQLLLQGFENKPKEKEKTISTHTRRIKAKGQDKISLPPDLPVRTQILDVPESQKACPLTGTPLVKIGEEISHKLAHEPGSYYVKEIIRPKYALPQGEGIIIAELPDFFLPKCRADESFLAELFVKKYVDHTPLYRIEEGLNREGIHISRQLLSQWILRGGEALKPLYLEMKKLILESGNIFIDETAIDLLAQGIGKAHKAFMWVVVGGKGPNPPYRIYDFKLDRKHDNAIKLLLGYRGIMHSDKYGAYETLASQKKEMIRCPCWSHIRRHFFEAETGDSDFRKWVLNKIGCLFNYEEIAWKTSAEERLKIRKEKEEPVIDELINAIKNRLIHGDILPKSKFKKALGYFCSLIPYLKNYINHPYARLDNNVAERAVRPLAIGRKNRLFVGSPKGGDAAAVLFSIVQTCRGLGINPREYLEDILRRIMAHSANKLYELLPDNWLKEKEALRSGTASAKNPQDG